MYAPCPEPLRARHATLHFDTQRHLMGILNVTPDSFSDGGRYQARDAAIARALVMLDEGASIIDLGGESTRPGATPVSAREQLERLLPVIDEILTRRPDALLSIDTTRAEVAEATLAAGACIINDISGLSFDPELASVVAHHDAALVLMHVRGDALSMHQPRVYEDVVAEVEGFWRAQLEHARAEGIGADQVILDPGLGFGGKSSADNYALLRGLERLSQLGYPLLIGPSRKRMIAAAIGAQRPALERDWGTAAAVACGALLGAHIMRVHEVAPMHDVLRVSEAVMGMGAGTPIA